jgi:hypothetical protein
MVVSCPGCARAVSEWAARCPACGSDLADAAVLDDEDWDAPVIASSFTATGGSRRRSELSIRIAGIALLVVALAAVLVVAEVLPRHSRSTHQILCSAPTATWSPGTPTQVGAPGAARVGPFTFHPAYFPDRPEFTRVILHPVTATTTPLTLTGWSCDTGRPFRFWYPPYGVNSELPQPISQAPNEGELTVTVPTLAAGNDFLGYMLFPKAGRWDVELWNGSALVGNILFVLAKA